MPNWASRTWLVILLACVAGAAYAGFRLPNLFSVTLYNMRFADGTIRRSLFGTIMNPLWRLANYQYGAYATVALGILALLLVVIVASATNARWNSQRILVALWLIAPTGAYVFHLVGYLDQVVYLLLFLSMWLWPRTRAPLAILPLVLSVFIHEIALLTTWPVMLWYAARGGATRGKWLALAAPSVAGVIAFSTPVLTESEMSAVIDRLHGSVPFPIREDAVALFGRTLVEASTMFVHGRGLVIVLPFAAAIAFSWGVAYFWPRSAGMTDRWLVGGALLASVAPLLLTVSGWDFSRWVLLSLSNLVLVAYFQLQDRDAEIPNEVLAAFVVPFLLLPYSPFEYYDGRSPRPITPHEIRQSVTEPDFFDFPIS